MLLLGLCLPAIAQRQILFNHLTVKQGLSQSSVTCIFQDRQGFMWFGTQDGLNRFDGYEIAVYKHDPAVAGSLRENFVVSIAEDSLGALWVGTVHYPGELEKFDRTSETFTSLPLDSVHLRGARISASNSGYRDPSGALWSGSIGGGVTRFDPRAGNTTTYKHEPSDPTSLADNRAYSVYGDRSGIVWIGTHEGLDRLEPSTGRFTHFKHDPANRLSLSDNWVWPILEDNVGRLWIGTIQGGLNIFDRQTGVFTHYRNQPSDPKSLGDDRLLSLYQDRSGIIWVGTGDHGVDYFQPDIRPFRKYTHDPANPASLSDDNVTPMLVDHAGAVWIGTAKGLDRFDTKTGSFTHYAHESANPGSLGEDTPQCLFEDRSGMLWIGLFSKGLDRFESKTGTFSHFRHVAENPGTLSDNRVYAVAEDPSGGLWVGTYGGGLNYYNTETAMFRTYLHSDSIPASLGGQGAWTLFRDHEGVLWIGTFGTGMDRFERASGTFTHFRHSEQNPSSLSDDNVLCVQEDRTGTLWIGTFDGLNRFDRGTGTFKHYKAKEGLPNNFIYGILEDTDGFLWVSTNKGLSKFDPRKETFRNYDNNDGLQGDEFNQNSYARNHVTGEMYFGGANGFNAFNPAEVRDNPYVPPVVFSSFVRYNTDFSEGKPIVEPGIFAKHGIALSYKDNIVTFEFAALSYYSAFKNRYAYKLEGFSDNWIQLGTERRATFTNLDGGKYTLRIKGSNNDGVWNEEGAALQLMVTPPWWKTKLAFGLYMVFAFGFLYTIRKFEINRREQKNQLREADLRSKAVEAEKRALTAENERKTKELEDARKLHFSMLPREVPQSPDYEISVFMRTSTEVGGDYYDFNTTPDGTINIAFGDATGHGMQAGTIVTLMKGLFLSDASRFDIQTFFNRCSNAIKEIRLGRLYMAFTLLRLKGNSLSLSSGGMPPAFLYRKATGSLEEILLKGMPLGAMKNFPYLLYEASLEKGDTILLLTDGLPEQKNVHDEMFDYPMVEKSFAEVANEKPEQIIRHLVIAGDTWMQGVTLDDDITLLVLQMKE